MPSHSHAKLSKRRVTRLLFPWGVLTCLRTQHLSHAPNCHIDTWLPLTTRSRYRISKKSTASSMSDESGPPVSGTSHPLTPDSLIKPHNSIAYWNKTPSTVSGMLGGFPQVSRIDITGSRTFLVKLLRISNPCPSPAPGKKL